MKIAVYLNLPEKVLVDRATWQRPDNIIVEEMHAVYDEETDTMFISQKLMKQFALAAEGKYDWEDSK
jgi:protein gp37